MHVLAEYALLEQPRALLTLPQVAALLSPQAVAKEEKRQLASAADNTSVALVVKRKVAQISMADAVETEQDFMHMSYFTAAP